MVEFGTVAEEIGGGPKIAILGKSSIVVFLDIKLNIDTFRQKGCAQVIGHTLATISTQNTNTSNCEQKFSVLFCTLHPYCGYCAKY